MAKTTDKAARPKKRATAKKALGAVRSRIKLLPALQVHSASGEVTIERVVSDWLEKPELDLRKSLKTDLVPDRSSTDQTLLARTEQVFGSRAKAEDWLYSPIASLGGAVPAELAKTPKGRQRVEDELVTIEYGAF